MTALIIGVIILAVILHLLGGLFHHRRHYQEHGVHPNLYYTYGRGWWGSVELPGGFRVGHRITVRTAGRLATVAAVLVFVVAVAAVRVTHHL
jgi:hypothetical protein